MLFIAGAVAIIAAGAIAQIWKRRTGALWGFLTLLLVLAADLLVGLSRTSPGSAFADPSIGADAKAATEAIFVVGIPFLVVLVVIATLPKRRRD